MLTGGCRRRWRRRSVRVPRPCEGDAQRRRVRGGAGAHGGRVGQLHLQEEREAVREALHQVTNLIFIVNKLTYHDRERKI